MNLWAELQVSKLVDSVIYYNMTVLKKSKQRLQWYIQVRVDNFGQKLYLLSYILLFPRPQRKRKETYTSQERYFLWNKPIVILVIINYFQIKRRKSQLMSTTCGHVFCDKCIRSAVQLQRRCPTCRKKLSLKQLHAIFL